MLKANMLSGVTGALSLFSISKRYKSNHEKITNFCLSLFDFITTFASY